MIREKNRELKLGLIFTDLLISALSFSAAVIFHFILFPTEKKVAADSKVLSLLMPETAAVSDWQVILSTYFMLGVIFVFFQIVIFIATDLYRPRAGRSSGREFAGILKGVLLNVITVLALLFFYRGTSFSRMVIIYYVVFSVAFHYAGHYFYRKYIIYLRSRGYRISRVLVLGTGASAARFVSFVNRNSVYGFRIEGIFGDKRSAAPELKPLISGSLKDFQKKAAELRADMVVYALPAAQSDHAFLTETVAFCDREGIDCRIIPDLVDMITHSARIEDLEGMPILTLRDIPLRNVYNRFLKRSFDILFSLAVLIIASPVFLLLAVLIKLDSKGPVFFLQERVGLDRKNFLLYKFRTMKVQEKNESDTKWGSKNDDRVTRIGRFLRKTSLDEIPQFINVLIGNMSVVGPRPERPHFVKQFKNQYDQYMRRHAVKAGITGYAQIKGYRGDTSIEKRVELDIYYIENWSFWLDLMITLKTIPALITSPGE